jgi:type I restriction enzyme S subunit
MASPRYESYRDSGVDWLGEIPTDWKIQRLGTVFEERKEKVSDKDFPPLSVTKNGILPQLDSAAKSDDGDNRKGVREGDFVINSRSDRKGSSGIAKQDGSVSLINIVLKPKGINPRYCEHLLKSNGFIEEFYRNGHGIVADLWTTRYWDMKSILIPLPDLQTQESITNFLDQKTAEIDEAIAKKQRLIELLKEQKTILINQAVTMGLNPDVRFIPTGNTFFPLLSERTSLVKLGYLCNKIADGPHFSPSYVDEGVMFLSAGNIRPDGWLLEDAKRVSERNYQEFCKRIVPEVGDVLYTKGGTTGVAKVVDISERFQVWVHVAVLKISKRKVDPYYLAYALNSAKCYEQSQLFTRGATNKDLGLTRMVNIVLPLPSLEEQKQIVAYLDDISTDLTRLIQLAEKEILILEEYRSVLISHIVTGKIKI